MWLSDMFLLFLENVCIISSLVTVCLSVWLVYEGIHGYKGSTSSYNKIKYALLFTSAIIFSLLKRTDITSEICGSQLAIGYFWNVYNTIVFVTIILFVKKGGKKA